MCVAIGTAALMIAEETGSMKPVAFGMLGYGFAYVVGSLWKEMRGKILAWSMGVFFVITILSPYTNMVLFVLFGYEGEINKFFLWLLELTVIGIPVMLVVFRKVRH
jgi:hypothetical protein